MLAQCRREYFFAQCPRFGFVHMFKTGAYESRLVDFHNERAERRRIAIVMRIKETKIGLNKGLRQVLKALGGAKPGKTIGEQIDACAELLLTAAPRQRIDTVCADNEIGIAQLIKALYRPLVDRCNSDRTCARLQ